MAQQHTLEETLKLIPQALQKTASIELNRNKTEDELTIRLSDREIYVSEYAKHICIDGIVHPLENAYPTLLNLVKANI